MLPRLPNLQHTLHHTLQHTLLTPHTASLSTTARALTHTPSTTARAHPPTPLHPHLRQPGLFPPQEAISQGAQAPQEHGARHAHVKQGVCEVVERPRHASLAVRCSAVQFWGFVFTYRLNVD